MLLTLHVKFSHSNSYILDFASHENNLDYFKLHDQDPFVMDDK